ncbi:MAG: hypothetical protein RBS57_16435 [Desulforhabdus sp.]|jgi:hypothetical protein|nr:hypothetical protein [Desulforhabdus sp.]
MSSENRTDERIKLANGLTVHFQRRSREIAGDRRQVQLAIRIPIEVEEIYFDDLDNPREAYQAYTSTVGKTVYFQVERVRNFVDLKEVQEALETLKKEFLRANLDYISMPSFARRFVLKSFHEWQEQKRLKEIYSQHISST